MKNTKFKEIIIGLSQQGIVHVDLGVFTVTLGNNGLYYLDLNEEAEVVCLNGCESEETCICARVFPNAMSFKTPYEVINFVELNLLNMQAEYVAK